MEKEKEKKKSQRRTLGSKQINVYIIFLEKASISNDFLLSFRLVFNNGNENLILEKEFVSHLWIVFVLCK